MLSINIEEEHLITGKEYLHLITIGSESLKMKVLVDLNLPQLVKR